MYRQNSAKLFEYLTYLHSTYLIIFSGAISEFLNVMKELYIKIDVFLPFDPKSDFKFGFLDLENLLFNLIPINNSQ